MRVWRYLRFITCHRIVTIDHQEKWISIYCIPFEMVNNKITSNKSITHIILVNTFYLTGTLLYAKEFVVIVPHLNAFLWWQYFYVHATKFYQQWNQIPLKKYFTVVYGIDRFLKISLVTDQNIKFWNCSLI